MPEIKEYQTPEYWNRRTKQNANDRRALLFRDPRFNEYESRTMATLLQWADVRALDVCCGFGRFAKVFDSEKYVGIDFSSEMIRRAMDENPDYTFYNSNAKEIDEIKNEYDLIFEVNSLHCLGMTPEEFYNQYHKFAKSFVACLECDRFTIFQIY